MSNIRIRKSRDRMGIAEMICRHHYLAVRRKLISTFQDSPAFPKLRSLAHFSDGQSPIRPKAPSHLWQFGLCKDQKLWLGQGDAVRGGIDGGGGDGGRGGKGMN